MPDEELKDLLLAKYPELYERVIPQDFGSSPSMRDLRNLLAAQWEEAAELNKDPTDFYENCDDVLDGIRDFMLERAAQLRQGK